MSHKPQCDRYQICTSRKRVCKGASATKYFSNRKREIETDYIGKKNYYITLNRIFIRDTKLEQIVRRKIVNHVNRLQKSEYKAEFPQM
ncbi:hypothetical protein RIR_jg36742.t1 [Rhizophagus irregularis DAOM 181602=DAOM 197198]|nr:hypothetical protein RIR_jg36742.t1 [Rhizophagus irregularis DAOM 181602=DAOM 197198]